MLTELFWIAGPWPGRLAISARPRGGDWLEDEIRDWRDAGIEFVVSLLMPDEVSDLNLDREQTVCEANGLRFLSLPIVDRGVPSSESNASKLIAQLDAELSRGVNINVHCRQGLGRAGMIASSLLIEKGVAPDQAIRRVSKTRGSPVPETSEQRDWIDHFAARMQRQR